MSGLTDLADRLHKLDGLNNALKFRQLGLLQTDLTAQLAEAREDALLAWSDTFVAAGYTRGEAVREMMAATGMARSSIKDPLCRAERRAGRPSNGPGGRPRKNPLSKRQPQGVGSLS